MQRKFTVMALVTAFGLASCGQTDLERGVTGAAVGAATASVLGGDALVGAALGGAAGVMCDDIGVAGCR